MNMTNPNILETERDGPPACEPKIVHCPTCDRPVYEEELRECPYCYRANCVRCSYMVLEIAEAFCSEETENNIYPADCMEKWLVEKLEKAETRAFEAESKLANLS